MYAGWLTAMAFCSCARFLESSCCLFMRVLRKNITDDFDMMNDFDWVNCCGTRPATMPPSYVCS